MFKIEYSTNLKGNLKKEFSKMEEIENFIKNRRLIKGFTFQKITDETGKEYLIKAGLKEKYNYKIEWK